MRKGLVVKKISHEQSRRNAARRRRKVQARHRLAGRWGERCEPMLTSGKITYEVGGNVDAMCLGGTAAVHRMVTKLGLPDQIDERLELLKVHLPDHESDHVLNLAYNVLCGDPTCPPHENPRPRTVPCRHPPTPATPTTPPTTPNPPTKNPRTAMITDPPQHQRPTRLFEA